MAASRNLLWEATLLLGACWETASANQEEGETMTAPRSVEEWANNLWYSLGCPDGCEEALADALCAYAQQQVAEEREAFIEWFRRGALEQLWLAEKCVAAIRART